MKVAVYEHVRDGGPQPGIITAGLLCRRWNRTPEELEQADLGRLLRMTHALDIYDIAQKPQKEWTPREAKLMLSIIALEVKKRAGQLVE